MSDFERVKQAVDLQQLITKETGVKMGRHFLDECPFCGGHDCFRIKEDLFNCFQCNPPRGGSAIDFLMHFHKVDEAQALEMAASFAGIPLTKQKKKLSVKDRIFMAAADYYHSLLSCTEAKAYLAEKRGHKENVLNAARAGWSDGKLHEHLVKNFSEDDLIASGLVRKKKGENGDGGLYDFLPAGVAIFPHFAGGRVLHFTFKDPLKQKEWQLPNDYRDKDWRFYGQDALKGDEIFIVEGENDRLSCLDAGIRQVMAFIGQPAGYQISAIEAQKEKKIYLWLDNDAAGVKNTRRICKELFGQNIKIILHPSGPEGTPEYRKDPDEYIQKLGCRIDIKALKENAVDYIGWELLQISAAESMEDRLGLLKEREIFRLLDNLPEAEMLAYVDRLVKLGFTKKAVLEQIEAATEIREEINKHMNQVEAEKGGKYNADYLADLVFKYFGRRGRYFTEGQRALIFYHDSLYEVGNNREFNSLMYAKTGRLIPTREPGRSIWEILASKIYLHGSPLKILSWKTTDISKRTLFFNFNSPNKKIIKLSPAGIEEIANALNDDGVLLKASDEMQPFTFDPDADVTEGLRLLKELVLDNIATEPEQRYFILCWLLSGFMLGFCPSRLLLYLSGASSSGKTVVFKMGSIIYYGTIELGEITTASLYTISSENPLVILDDFEEEDRTKGSSRFMRLSATGGQKRKRKAGTDRDTVKEKPDALIGITAIDPFEQVAELTRMADISVDRHRWGNAAFVESDVYEKILQNRNLVLSSILKFMGAEVLPHLDDRKVFMTTLREAFKGHSKNRMDEHLALMILILRKILKYMHDENDALAGTEIEDWEIWKAWVEYQDRKSKDAGTASSQVVKLLDGLVREYQLKMKDVEPLPLSNRDYQEYEGQNLFAYTHQDYFIEMIKTVPDIKTGEKGDRWSECRMEFVATAGEITSALDRYAKNNGIFNPMNTAAKFVNRLKNERQFLEKSGWELVTPKGKDLGDYWRIARGERFYKFRKVILR